MQSNGTVSVKPQEAIPAMIVESKMRESLRVVMPWQAAELPPRFAIGSGDLRKVAIRVREQPLNFMIIIHQSLKTAGEGKNQCKAGSKAVRVLLGEEEHSEHDRARFVTETLDRIQTSASDLNNRTNDIKHKFRILRTAVLDLHKDVNGVTSEEQRSAFLARLSRVLSKDVGICEDELRNVRKNLEEIENSLNLITHWWQKVESEANYLKTNGDSSLMSKENRILLNRVRESFMNLETWFVEYIHTMQQLFDENVGCLNEVNRKYLTKAQESV